MTDSTHDIHVLIAGGGLGGLALAAGLHTRGIRATVFERDVDLTRTGGYHIHLDRAAVDDLRQCLVPRMFERVLAASATTRVQGGDVLRDMRGRVIHRSRPADDDGGVNIDRVTLRVLLAEASADVRTGCAVTAFRRDPEGGVSVTTSRNEEHVGALLVGAEGVGSVIANTLAAGPTSTPTGLLGVGGRTRVDDLPPEVRRHLGADSGLAIGPGGTGLYVGYHDPIGQAAVVPQHLSDSITIEPTYIWGAVLSESTRTEHLRPLRREDLRDATLTLLRAAGWSRPMLDVIEQTDLDGLATFRFHAAAPDPRRLAPWPASSVTALGDAVHAMPPTAGRGAATAIADAADLARRLAGVATGTETMATAVHAFEHGMRRRGALAVSASLRPVGIIHATATPFGRAAARAGLPLGAALARFRSRL